MIYPQITQINADNSKEAEQDIMFADLRIFPKEKKTHKYICVNLRHLRIINNAEAFQVKIW